jgi:UDP-N-acetylglucosamine:LPS N-acetylglucosamine transferase
MILEEALSGHLLAERIDYFADNPDVLHQIAKKAKGLGKPDAAKAIAEDCYRLIKGDR